MGKDILKKDKSLKKVVVGFVDYLLDGIKKDSITKEEIMEMLQDIKEVLS